MRLWEKEYGPEYEVPPELEALGWTGISWHNGMCPSFTPAPDKNEVRPQGEYPDPDMREYVDQPRYVINRMDAMEKLGYEESIIAAADDLAEILAVARTFVPKQIAKGSRLSKGLKSPGFNFLLTAPLL